MATEKQRKAARKNIQKARATWRSMGSSERAKAQPEGRGRQKPGSRGEGAYFHVVVRPKEGFATFRTQDVGTRGHIQRVAGKRTSGGWDTVKWLISKDDAHIESRTLVPDTKAAEKVLKTLGSEPKKVRGHIFRAKPRRDIPERDKPTRAQVRARSANIKKAQAARRAAG